MQVQQSSCCSTVAAVVQDKTAADPAAVEGTQLGGGKVAEADQEQLGLGSTADVDLQLGLGSAAAAGMGTVAAAEFEATDEPEQCGHASAVGRNSSLQQSEKKQSRKYIFECMKLPLESKCAFSVYE